MANNFKSVEITRTAGGSPTLVNCTTTSAIVSSILVAVADAGSAVNPVASMELFLQKSGGSVVSLKIIKAGTNFLVKGTTTEMLEKNIVLENGDALIMTFGTFSGGGSVTVVANYMERTASVATSNLADLNDVSSAAATSGQVLAWDGTQWEPTTSSGTLTDTGDLAEQSSGTEPLNRYMKNLNSLAALTDGVSSAPEDVLSDTPGNVNFVVENNTLSPAPPQKVTFDQIIQALMVGPLTDIANDPSNNLSLATFTGSGGVGDFNNDGEVGSGDLLDFLTWFGNSWAGANSNLFQPSKMTFTDGVNTLLNDTTWTTIQFDSADYTVTAGTQNVTVDHTTNHSLKLTSQTSPYLLKDVPNKYIELSTEEEVLAIVTTEISNQRITIRATIDLYDSSDIALGSQATFEWHEKGFWEASTHAWTYPGVRTILNSEIAALCSVTDGMENGSFHSVVITLQAKTNSGNATLDLRTPVITLKQA